MARPTLFIVDGNGYIYRAFFALPPLTNSRGEPTNAVFGFTKMLMKLVNGFHPDYLVITFDSKEKTLRAEKFEEYKAHRPPMPEELKPQLGLVRQVVEAFRIPSLELAGYEADDLIATLVNQHKENFDIHIVTGDKDLMQLVEERVWINDTMKDREYDRSKVFEKMGVYPEQIVDLLALMGDSSDNIPGVPGIGPKTGAKLLGEYGSLEKIYEHLAEIKGAIQTKLRENKELAFLSQELARLHVNVELPQSIQDFILKTPDWDKLRTLFTDLGFQALQRDLDTRGIYVNGHSLDKREEEIIDLVEDVFGAESQPEATPSQDDQMSLF